MSGHAIHIKIDGRTYAGTYQVDRKILTVTTPYGRKSAEIAPKVAHDTLAHQLLQRAGPAGKGPQGLDLLIVRHPSQLWDLAVVFGGLSVVAHALAGHS
ncbi:hypothetical protein [Microvirga sp. G4-2]|uniref:hypothetical protein n=1 Tax=Microvirga sp. G4-2 TaxID=3434467 RepID=UPI004043C9E6